MSSIGYPGSRLERKDKQQYHINQKSTVILLIHHAITTNQSVQIHNILNESSHMEYSNAWVKELDAKTGR